MPDWPADRTSGRRARERAAARPAAAAREPPRARADRAVPRGAISLPLAIVVARAAAGGIRVLAIASVIQTVPGLALLALMVPVLAKTGAACRRSVSARGDRADALRDPADPAQRGDWPARRRPCGDRGRARDGHVARQIMRLVQLPLAAPVIAAGIRTATVWTVGAATLATPVGQPCLGNYIFAGLQTRNSRCCSSGSRPRRHSRWCSTRCSARPSTRSPGASGGAR